MPPVARIRRRALETAAAVAGAAALLVGVFWLARGWPSVSPCERLDVADRQAVDAFRAGAAPLHGLAASLILVALARLSAARRSPRGPAPATVLACAVYAALLSFVLIGDPDAAGVQMLVLLATAPLTGFALLVAVALLLAYPVEEDGAAWVVLAAWAALVLVIPGHYAAISSVDQVFFCD